MCVCVRARLEVAAGADGEPAHDRRRHPRHPPRQLLRRQRRRHRRRHARQQPQQPPRVPAQSTRPRMRRGGAGGHVGIARGYCSPVPPAPPPCAASRIAEGKGQLQGSPVPSRRHQGNVSFITHGGERTAPGRPYPLRIPSPDAALDELLSSTSPRALRIVLPRAGGGRRAPHLNWCEPTVSTGRGRRAPHIDWAADGLLPAATPPTPSARRAGGDGWRRRRGDGLEGEGGRR